MALPGSSSLQNKFLVFCGMNTEKTCIFHEWENHCFICIKNNSLSALKWMQHWFSCFLLLKTASFPAALIFPTVTECKVWECVLSIHISCIILNNSSCCDSLSAFTAPTSPRQSSFPYTLIVPSEKQNIQLWALKLFSQVGGNQRRFKV